MESLLGKSFPCRCGQTHTVTLATVYVGEGAYGQAADYVAQQIKNMPSPVSKAGETVYLVADTTTFHVAGEQLARHIEQQGVRIRPIVLPVPLVPDEKAQATVKQSMKESGWVMAVGAGTIHDLARYVAYEKDFPFVSVPTAPSVDGFASSVSALIQSGQKRTLPARMPQALFADTATLAEAPMELIAAGFGDILGKTTSLADWHVSRIINDEWYCPFIAEIVTELTKQTAENAEAIRVRNPEAIEALIRALIVSGIAIDMAQSSRPASGSEHHFSHYLEMRSLWSGVPDAYHGTKVGVGTIMSARLYEKVWRHIAADGFSMGDSYDGKQMAARVRQRVKTYFGPLVDMVSNDIQGRYEEEGVNARLERIRARIEQLRAEPLPLLYEAHELERFLRAVGAPINCQELGISRDWALGGVLVGKEVRERYTIFQLADDLDVLESYAEEVLH